MAVIVDSTRQVLVPDGITMGFTSRNAACLCLILDRAFKEISRIFRSHSSLDHKRDTELLLIMLGAWQKSVQRLKKKKTLLVSIITPNPKTQNAKKVIPRIQPRQIIFLISSPPTNPTAAGHPPNAPKTYPYAASYAY